MPPDGPPEPTPGRRLPGVRAEGCPPGDQPQLDDGRDVYWFVGGPLDGRVQTRPQAEPAPTVVRHQHLHDGPKIVHHYDLHEVAGRGGEYRVRAEDCDAAADGECAPDQP